MDFTRIYSYSFPTDIRFGKDCIKELPAYLHDHKLSRPLIVTDQIIQELSFFKKLTRSMDDLGTEVFSDIHKNPVKSDVLKGGECYETSKCDCIIGIGGGAAMDVARAITLRINHKRDLFDYDDLIGGDRLITNDMPHFVTVPTTSGTGSEVGRSAIISEDDSKRKRILFHPKLLAKQVFADPMLTMELPPAITAATGIDALTHNMEAYISKGFHPMAEGIALEGMALIFNSVENAVKKPDIENRSKMMIASLMGAVAFQKGLGIVHSLAHPLSTLLDMHHGLANAMMIPYGMQFNYRGLEKKFDRMAIAMGFEKSEGSKIPEKLFKLKERLSMPAKLGDLGVREEHIDSLTELALADFCLPLNPKEVTADDVKSIYKAAI